MLLLTFDFFFKLYKYKCSVFFIRHKKHSYFQNIFTTKTKVREENQIKAHFRCISVGPKFILGYQFKFFEKEPV